MRWALCAEFREYILSTVPRFNVYSDMLGYMLSMSRVGFHVAVKPTNNFTYADD